MSAVDLETERKGVSKATAVDAAVETGVEITEMVGVPGRAPGRVVVRLGAETGVALPPAPTRG